MSETSYSLVGKYCLSFRNGCVFMGGGKILSEPSAGVYVVGGRMGPDEIVLASQMSGWKFFDTQKDIIEYRDNHEKDWLMHPSLNAS